MDIFQVSGKVPLEIEALIICVRAGATMSATDFRSSLLTSSKPELFLGLSYLQDFSRHVYYTSVLHKVETRNLRFIEEAFATHRNTIAGNMNAVTTVFLLKIQKWDGST